MRCGAFNLPSARDIFASPGQWESKAAKTPTSLQGTPSPGDGGSWHKGKKADKEIDYLSLSTAHDILHVRETLRTVGAARPECISTATSFDHYPPPPALPRSQLKALLREKYHSGEAPLSQTQLNTFMRERTGQVWNKRFKRRHGAMLPFILDNLHIFTITEAEEIGLTPAALACALGETKSISRDIVNEEDDGVEVAAAAEGAAAGEAWFNVNDSQVTCVTDKALTEQFSGRECAYMLFYVRRTFLEDTRDTVPEPPAWLQAAVDSENAVLQEQRRTYDEVAHRVKLYVVSAGAFTVETNVLRPKMEEDHAQEFGLAGVGGKDETAFSAGRVRQRHRKPRAKTSLSLL